MSITSKIRGLLAPIGFLLVAILCSQTANAGSIFPTIPDPGFPRFINDVKVRVTPNGKWSFTGKDGFLFKTASSTYEGFQSSYKLTAWFDDNNNLDTKKSSLTFQGSIPTLGINDKVTLLTADLTGFDYLNNTVKDTSLMGFNTHITGGEICVVIGCTLNESIYVVMDNLVPDLLKGNNFTSAGFAVTTIPVPAAVWLFGSGLCMLGMVAKRRKQKA